MVFFNPFWVPLTVWSRALFDPFQGSFLNCFKIPF